MNKKGQMFEQLGGLATGIVALAILLVVAFLIMSQGKEVVVGLIDSTGYANETKSITADVFATFENCVDDQALSLTTVYNDTDSNSAVTYGTGNWTVVLNTVNFSNKLNDATPFATSINLTYSCKEPDEAYNATESLQNATSGIPSWVPIIVITFIGVILLGLVALIRRSQRSV